MNTLQIILILVMMYIILPVVWYYHVYEPTNKKGKK